MLSGPHTALPPTMFFLHLAVLLLQGQAEHYLEKLHHKVGGGEGVVCVCGVCSCKSLRS